MTAGAPDIPSAGAPDVSVVLVSYNAWALTRQALDALVANTEPGRYEVVIVDNASSDATGDGLARQLGATVVRNSRNRGFGPACNQGVARSRGRHVVLLNTDALVEPGWLDPLLAIADADPAVAAVGSMLLHPTGRLQEAASILWREGRVLNYGDGDDPEKPEYCFTRDVDYASAACLLVRRSAFGAVGGFDPVYAPAYFEDADLCLTLRAAGGRVVYQPRSRAVHLRWGSGGRRGAERLIARNHPVFRARWRSVLAHRPPESVHRAPAAVIGGRDAICSERLLLLVTAVASLGEIRIRRLIETVRAGWPDIRLTVVALAGLEPRAELSALQEAGVEVVSDQLDWPAWFAARRFHYGAVLVAAELSDAVREGLAASQPQARVASGGDPRPATGRDRTAAHLHGCGQDRRIGSRPTIPFELALGTATARTWEQSIASLLGRLGLAPRRGSEPRL